VKRVDSLIKDADGSVSIMMVILMFAFVGLLAFVIDLAHLQTVKNELQNASDACALRGARAFYPDDKTALADNANERESAGIPQAEAKDTVKMNYSDVNLVKTPLQEVKDEDVKVGVWNFETRQWLYVVGGEPVFTWPPDAADYGKVIGPGISLKTRKETGINSGPVAMTVAKIFGVSSVNVNATGTAALSPLGEVGEDNWDENGQPPPLQIGDKYATEGSGTLTLHPDNTDTGGWHSYYGIGNPNKTELENLIWGKTKSGADVEIPSIDVSQPGEGAIERLNGVIADLFQPNNDRSLISRWMQITGYTIDNVGNITNEPGFIPNTWTVTLPVTSSDGPYVGTSPVLGFVRCTIDRVYPPNYPDPTKKLSIDISISEVKWVSTGHGGGRYYGVIALDPKLVQ
jgi:hypothetical protein